MSLWPGVGLWVSVFYGCHVGFSQLCEQTNNGTPHQHQQQQQKQTANGSNTNKMAEETVVKCLL